MSKRRISGKKLHEKPSFCTLLRARMIREHDILELIFIEDLWLTRTKRLAVLLTRICLKGMVCAIFFTYSRQFGNVLHVTDFRGKALAVLLSMLTNKILGHVPKSLFKHLAKSKQEKYLNLVGMHTKSMHHVTRPRRSKMRRFWREHRFRNAFLRSSRNGNRSVMQDHHRAGCGHIERAFMNCLESHCSCASSKAWRIDAFEGMVWAACSMEKITTNAPLIPWDPAACCPARPVLSVPTKFVEETVV